MRGVMSVRLFTVLLSAIVITSALFASGATGLRADTGPLEPIDASSPRATLTSFLDQTQVVEEATLLHLANRTAETRNVALAEVSATAPLFDLSEVAEAARAETLQQSFAALADILYRVPVPPFVDIPDAQQVEAEQLTRWVLPGTEITLVQLTDEERPGDWVFSAQTVANLPAWRSKVEQEPILNQSAQITDWRGLDTDEYGRWVPGSIIESLPAQFQREILGNPLWKVLTGFILLIGILLVTVLWHRFVVTRLARTGRVGVMNFLVRLSTPIVLIALTIAGRNYMELQVNHGGQFAQIVLRSSAGIVIIALAWLAWLLVRVISEWIIATSAISEKRYNEHLVRLLSRLFSLLAAATVLVIGANSLGIPALGLITGVGVGGLVVGLAAQNTLENLLGGFTLFADKPFRVGDFVTFSGVSGTVEEIGQRSTRFRLIDGTVAIVPNADLVKAQITNITERRGSLFLHTVGVRYETTAQQLQEIIAGIDTQFRAHPLVFDQPDLPRVTLTEFGDSAIDIQARALVDTNQLHQFMLVQQDLLLIMREVVEQAGAAIAFPSTTAYLAVDSGSGDTGALREVLSGE